MSPEEPVAATELAVEPAAALAEAVAPAFPSTLDDCTHTHKQEHKAHMQEGKGREERREMVSHHRKGL